MLGGPEYSEFSENSELPELSACKNSDYSCILQAGAANACGIGIMPRLPWRAVASAGCINHHGSDIIVLNGARGIYAARDAVCGCAPWGVDFNLVY